MVIHKKQQINNYFQNIVIDINFIGCMYEDKMIFFIQRNWNKESGLKFANLDFSTTCMK